MQGPITDVARLLLLVVFFGRQQHRSPQRYVRYWFVGWVFVLCSCSAWVGPERTPPLLHLQAATSFDFMLLAALVFLAALLSEEKLPRRVMLPGSVIGVINVAIINLSMFVAVPKVLLVLVIVCWQIEGLFLAHKLLPKNWVQRRSWTFGVCVVYGALMLVYVGLTSGRYLEDLAIAQVMLFTAVLYRKWEDRRSISRWAGTLGFAAWAAIFLLELTVGKKTNAGQLLYSFWNFPSYFVAFTMIRKVREGLEDEKEKLNDRYRELYEDFRLIYESHPYPMWISDGAGGDFVMANGAALEVYGYDIEEFKLMRMVDLELQPSEEEDGLYEELEAPEEGTLMRHRRKDGSAMWVNLVQRDLMYLGREARFMIARDITEQLKLDKELSYRAQHDVLTGLPNRQLLADRLTQCLRTCERDQRRAAILTIDVDHFKLINDTYGHLVGDECLQAVAERLKSKIRKVDTIARTGGEEFMAVVSGLNHVSDGEKVAEALLRVFDAPLNLSVGEVRVTVSIGMAIYPDDGMESDTLRSLSDEAVYRAKREGRNRAAYGYEVTARRNHAHGVLVATGAVAGPGAPAKPM
jgi:diguanylate cyclase (GGDEF)-like protein/PAS domain S-box-containing protein